GGHHLLHRGTGELPGKGSAWPGLAVECGELGRRRDSRGGACRLVVAAQAAFQGVHGLSGAPDRSLLPGLALAVFGAIAFSGKAIIVKLAYRYGVDAVTLIMYRMLFALPIFVVMAWWASRGKQALTGRDWVGVISLGITGYYLSSFLDFAGLAYVT